MYPQQRQPFQNIKSLKDALPVCDDGRSHETVYFRDYVSEHTISSNPSSKTLSDIRSTKGEQLREASETSSVTRQRLAEINKRIKNAEESTETTSRTREELRKKEGYLAKLLMEKETTSRTRERLSAIEDEIASAERKMTSSRTREELARKELKLRELKERSVIGTSTRIRMDEVDRAIREEKKRSKEIRESTESVIMRKERELSHRREVNARKECIKQVLRNIKIAQITDLAFLLDCTGSMDQYITVVRNEIKQMVKKVQEDHPDLKLKVAFVGYRDHNDSKRIEKLPFTENCDEFSKFLDNVSADGGGDAAEDVFGGLEEIGKLEWNAPSRVLMHFGDAPCHGNRFHDDVLDDDATFNDMDRRGLKIEDLLSHLKQLNIRYYFGQINNSTDKMVTVFREVAGDQNFPYIVNAAETSLISSVVSESVSSTISATIDQVTKIPFRRPAIHKTHDFNTIKEQETILPYRSRKDYVISNTVPNWDRLAAYIVESINANPPNDFSDLKEPLKLQSLTRSLKIASQPFAEGGQRISYKGLDCSPALELPKETVLKEFKHHGDKYEDYMAVLESHCLAEFLAKEFNKVNDSQKICYLRVNVVKFVDGSGKERIYTCESLLENYETGFQKWTNNASYVNKVCYSDTITAFSHWTYEKTNGYLMICDLQGVERRGQYILTDPGMHCTDVLRFGNTNFGEFGMERFFQKHKCNDVCRKLGLKKRR